MSLIISGFPGVGKTTFCKNNTRWKVADLASSKFDKKDFPGNYIEYIKKLIEEKYDVIMVSSHLEVRRALRDNELKYIIVHPDDGDKEIYLERYRQRGSSDDFVELMDSSWKVFIDSIYDDYKWVNYYMAWHKLKNGGYLDEHLVSSFLKSRIVTGNKEWKRVLCKTESFNEELFGINQDFAFYDACDAEFMKTVGRHMEDFEMDDETVWVDWVQHGEWIGKTMGMEWGDFGDGYRFSVYEYEE